MDTLGRPFYAIQKDRYLDSGNWQNADYHSHVVLDILGNKLEVHDARGLVALSYGYNYLKAVCKQESIDSSVEFMLGDAAGMSLRMWDADNRAFRNEYDVLRRPKEKWVGTKLLETMEYGENLGSTTNHNGQLYKSYDCAGVVTIPLTTSKEIPKARIGNKLTILI